MKSKIVALSRNQDFKDLINEKKITNKYRIEWSKFNLL